MTVPTSPRRIFGLVSIALASALFVTACGSDGTSETADGDQNQDQQGSAEDEAADDAGAEADAGGGNGENQDPAAGDDGGAADADGGDFPREVETAAGTVLIEAEPESIVSLSPTATEIEGTLDGLVPDLEAILANDPDLVVASGLPEDVEAGLVDSGVAVMLLPAAQTFDDSYDQIAQLGEATGQLDQAAALNAEIRADVDELLVDLPEADTPIRVFHEIDDSFYTATSASFIGQVYETMGFVNIADPLDDGTGFPLVDGESILAADPSLIVFTSQAPYTAEDIAARPGWSGVTAVASGNIVQVDADIASRWGPRIVEFMRAVADVVAVPA